ncbi:MAG: DNA-binding response regulator, partial [Coriobacteriaceae bacterium]
MKNRILIVEDDPEVARLIQMTLRSADYKYGIARNGNTTLQFIPIFQPDVLLLDLMLPDMDGMDIIKQIRAANNNIPIIVISARDEDADKVQALDLGADDYLTKPFSIDELLARIRVSLRRTNIIYNNGKTNINNYCNGELT